MCKYRRVTYEDRCHIFKLIHSKISINDIAKRLNFSRTTIYREMKRNTRDAKYCPFQADLLAQQRFLSCKRNYKIQNELEASIDYHLFNGWSPEQISGRISQEKNKKIISAQSIYNYIKRDRADLKPLLKRYKKYGGGRDIQRRSSQKNKLSIHERPENINRRIETGHFERDGMRFSEKGKEVLVCVDRKSLYMRLDLLTDMKPSLVTKATENLLKDINYKSMTNDNGLEFRDSKNLSVPVYFCDPGSPQQRGTVENMIGKLRFYLSRKSNPNIKYLKYLENLFNFTPRKRLNYLTPHEVFFNTKVALAS